MFNIQGKSGLSRLIISIDETFILAYDPFVGLRLVQQASTDGRDE